jgi:hypothetical protein
VPIDLGNGGVVVPLRNQDVNVAEGPQAGFGKDRMGDRGTAEDARRSLGSVQASNCGQQETFEHESERESALVGLQGGDLLTVRRRKGAVVERTHEVACDVLRGDGNQDGVPGVVVEHILRLLSG